MERIPVKMIRDDLENLPHFKPPEGFRIRLFKSGDEENWARIKTSVDEFANFDKALEHFKEEFSPYPYEMSKRCFFLENSEGTGIGTITAWYNHDFMGKNFGRIHWLSVQPEYQGKGLAKSLLSTAMNCLKQYHARAYLTSQTTSFIALKIYLDFGFLPIISDAEDKRAWALVDRYIQHPMLAHIHS